MKALRWTKHRGWRWSAGQWFIFGRFCKSGAAPNVQRLFYEVYRDGKIYGFAVDLASAKTLVSPRRTIQSLEHPALYDEMLCTEDDGPVVTVPYGSTTGRKMWQHQTTEKI